MAKLKNFEKDIMKLVEYDFKDEFADEYTLPNGRLFSDLDDFEKWLIYKISDNKGDCDRSELALEIYDKVWKQLPKCENQSYCSGETLNSFLTPLISYLTIKVNDYKKVLFLNEDRKLRGYNYYEKYRINDKKGNIVHSATLSNLIYKNYSIFTKTDDRIKTYARTTHTIGNFMPVAMYFNMGRRVKTSDYWDLTLLGIYKYYNEKKSKESLKSFLSEYDNGNGRVIEQELVIASCNKWLSGIGTWNDFVMTYFFQDFVSGNEDNGFGEPIMFWENHSFEKRNPESEDDINQFLCKINDLIFKRGKRLCNTLTKLYSFTD